MIRAIDFAARRRVAHALLWIALIGSTVFEGLIHLAAWLVDVELEDVDE